MVVGRGILAPFANDEKVIDMLVDEHGEIAELLRTERPALQCLEK